MAGVYVSIPFCAQKCTYCNFASGVFPAALEADYYRVLRGEIAAHPWEWIPETVYFGGGSPSRTEASILAGLLEGMPGRPWREATLEAAPGDLTRDKVRIWRDAGINRVSFGVQSFVKRELAQTGRKHTAETVAADVALLREEGIANISVDLIAGLPHQTLASFTESLDWVERLAVPHVSVYMLEVDEDSRLGAELLAGGQRYGSAKVPGDDEIVAMYQLAVERLGATGVPRYEISNFARPGYESWHNLKYWRLEPYVGFGADAHGFDGVKRRQNAETAAEYVSRANMRLPLWTAETQADREQERLLVGLRLTAGVEVAELTPALSRYVDEGLLQRDGRILRLTDRGVLLSNEVFEEFVTA